MPTGRPDYTSSTVIRGRAPSGSLVPVALDESGNLVALIYGSDGTVLRQVRVDTSGQMIMVPRGQSGNYMAVDALGNLAAKIKGNYAGAPADVLLDAQGRIVAAVYGLDGTTPRPIIVDASGQMIMVPRGQSGNYMAVDAAGNLAAAFKGAYGGGLVTVAVDATGHIIGVLQGSYAGTLTTLAVDAQGRIQAVLTDPEDVFGNPSYMGAAELASRLGSIDRFERRGTTRLLESFEQGLHRYDFGLAGTGAAYALSTDRARSGAYSVKLTAGSDGGAYAGILASEPAIVPSKVGMEVHSNILDDCASLQIIVSRYTGASSFQGSVQWVKATSVLRFLDSSGNWQTFATGINLPINNPTWVAHKLVCDFTTNKYTRFVLDGTVYNLSASALLGVVDTRAPRIDFIFYNVGRAGFNDSTFVDDLIITEKETS